MKLPRGFFGLARGGFVFGGWVRVCAAAGAPRAVPGQAPVLGAASWWRERSA